MFVTKKMPRSLSAEVYRSLRTRIKLLSNDKKFKTIIVTSSIIGEGKSTVSGNLAYVLSQDGARVLVVDCDLRKPSIHINFSVPNEVGLTDILVGNCELKNAIKKIDDNIFLITAGTVQPNPSEILGSNDMQKLIDELASNYDYIIVDTAPVLTVTDTLLLASKADATILVVKARSTKEKMVKQSYDKLVEVRANIIGTVLNECDKSLDNKYYGYYRFRKIENK